MFAYCNNSPINFVDPNGELAITISTLILIASAVVGAACAGYTAYSTYNAGYEIADVIWYSVYAGLSGFLTAYTLGTTAYQLYLNFCMLNGITPVTEITIPGTQQEYVEVYGASKPPEQGIPNSTYNKVDSDGVTVVQTAQYNASGKVEYRVDYYAGSKPHTHFDKFTQMYLYDHVHFYFYNENGDPCGKHVGPL